MNHLSDFVQDNNIDPYAGDTVTDGNLVDTPVPSATPPAANTVPDPVSDSTAQQQEELVEEVALLEKAILESNLPDELAERALRNIKRLKRMAKFGSYTSELDNVDKYVDWITGIPWGKYSDDNLDITHAKEIMDSTHYGMDTVKDLVLDYLAVMQLEIDRGKGIHDYPVKGAINNTALNGVGSPASLTPPDFSNLPQPASLPLSMKSAPVSSTVTAPSTPVANINEIVLKTPPVAAATDQASSDVSTLAAVQAIAKEHSGEMAVLRGSSANAPVMLFVGLQGVGKTSIAKSIATAMGRKFVRIALGAIGTVHSLRGKSRMTDDAEPSQIVKALVKCGSMNPVILLDEIDKSSGNVVLLNDIMAALLEILDPEQNNTFTDHYIDYPIDLSKVFFICTANNLGTLSAALLDRMEVIRFTSYTDEEKTVIAQNYSLPKVLKNTSLTSDDLIVDDDVWPILVRPVGFDAGLRQLERNLATMVRSAARKIIEGAPRPIRITRENIRDFVLPDQGPLS